MDPTIFLLDMVVGVVQMLWSSLNATPSASVGRTIVLLVIVWAVDIVLQWSTVRDRFLTLYSAISSVSMC